MRYWIVLAIALATAIATAHSQISGPSPFRSIPVTFAALPACNAGSEGTVAAINDSNSVVWGANAAGSSTNHVLVYCNAAAWTVAAK